MKIVIFAAITLLSLTALAESTLNSGTVSLSASEMALISPKSNTAEAGLETSSINNGTTFATIAMVHEFVGGYSLGVRGFVPMDFHGQSNAYMVQILARFMFMNDVNQLYAEPRLTQGFFNDTKDTIPFVMLGANMGYNRMLTKEISVGGHLGVDFASVRIAGNRTESGRLFYNNIGVGGNYYF